MDEENKKEVSEKEIELPVFFQNKYFWIITVLITIVVGYFILKVLFAPFEDFRLTLVHSPPEVAAGTIATFTWRIDGSPTTINHTTVYLGQQSNPGELGKDVKPTETKYSLFVKDFIDGKYDVPLQFVGNIKIDVPGKYYFRVYALIKGKNFWTDEYTLEVK